MNLEAYREILVGLTPEQRRYVLEALPKHQLEKEFGIRAERILDAIARSSDLSKRGIRGLIAEEVFLKDVLPAQLAGSRWKAEDVPASNASYDALVRSDSGQSVRIQVKNQRLEKGVVKVSKGNWIVEVQKTRTGEDKDGVATRPYRFADFDLIAVCLKPGTEDWMKFAFSLTQDLLPRPKDPNLIKIMQPVPQSVDLAPWSSSLLAKLDALAKEANSGK